MASIKYMGKVPENLENKNDCICPSCPTHNSIECPAKNNETLYCARGKTICEVIDKGCPCGQCPIWDKYSLSGGYFCLEGASE